MASLSREERLLFIGLWSYVDDNGVGIDDYRLIASDLFPLDEDQNETRAYVQSTLDRLSRETIIARFSRDGRSYLYINTWRLHQRVDNPNKPRFPLPDDVSTSDDANGRRSDARDGRETVERGGTGTEEQVVKEPSPSSPSPRQAPAEPPGFADFYDAYPRKRERKKAAIAYRSALKAGATPERLLQAAQTFALSQRGKKIEYVKYPASWLNAGAYDDEPEQVGLALVAGGNHVVDPARGVFWEQ